MSIITMSKIKEWLKKAKADGVAYLIIGYDRFDDEHYGVPCMDVDEYVKERQKFQEHQKQYEGLGDEMLEVYDLSLPIEEQLEEYRSWHDPFAKLQPKSPS